MSRFTAWFDRNVPGWRHRGPAPLAKSSRQSLIRRVRHLLGTLQQKWWWVAFVGFERALKVESAVSVNLPHFESCCDRLKPLAVRSSAELLDGAIRVPRLWIVGTPRSVPASTRTLTVEGELQSRFADVSPPTMQQAYLRLRRAIIVPKFGVILAEPDLAIQSASFGWASDHRLFPGFIGFESNKLLIRQNGLYPARRIRTPVIALCDVFHRNYGHWLCQYPQHLLPWLDDLREGRLAVLVPPAVGEWQRRVFDILGVPRDAVIEAYEHAVLCDDVVVPGFRQAAPGRPAGEATNMRYPFPFMNRALNDVIEVLKKTTPQAKHISPPERIYVSRRGLTSYRIVLNEDEVEEKMTQLGFAIVHPEELTFDEQVTMFSRARVIVGPHGAGMTNAVFSPSSCLIADFYPDTCYTMWLVQLTHLFNHYHLPICYPSDRSQSQPVLLNGEQIQVTHVYRASPNDLGDAIEKAMRLLNISTQTAGSAAN